MARWCNQFAALFFCCVHSCSASATPNKSHRTLNCRQTAYGLGDFNSGTTKSVAPNGSNHVLLAKDGSFRVFRGQTEIGSIHPPDLSSNIEIVWAQDSDKFSITYSDGGAEGAFHALIYELTEIELKQLPRPVDAAFSDFKKRYYCQKRGNNIFVEGWTPDSTKIVFIVQVYPTGDCGEIFGKLGGYMVDLTGKIVRRYSEKQAQSIQQSCDKIGRASDF